MWEAHHQTQLLLNAVGMSFHSKIEPWSSNYHLDWMLLGLLTMMCSSSRQAFLEERLSINCVWTPLAVIVLRAKWSSTVIDLHLLPALVFAPRDPKKFACRLTVFEPHWLSLFCAPSEPEESASRPIKVISRKGQKTIRLWADLARQGSFAIDWSIDFPAPSPSFLPPMGAILFHGEVWPKDIDSKILCTVIDCPLFVLFWLQGTIGNTAIEHVKNSLHVFWLSTWLLAISNRGYHYARKDISWRWTMHCNTWFKTTTSVTQLHFDRT